MGLECIDKHYVNKSGQEAMARRDCMYTMYDKYYM